MAEADDHTVSSTPLSEQELARLRQVIYRLFASLFLYPDEERLVALRAAAGYLQQIEGAWGDFPFSESLRQLVRVLTGVQETPSQQIEEEYVSLFLARPDAPPHESFQLDLEGHTRGLMAVQLEAEYAAAGLAMAPSLGELPDHIAVELEFMSFLCDEEVQAWEREDRNGAVQVRASQGAFLNRHLGRWFPSFSRQVSDASPDTLYGAVADAAQAFLQEELSQAQ